MLPASIAYVVPYFISFPSSFYQGFAVEHANFSQIPTIPSSEWRSNATSAEANEWDFWVDPFTACVFFATFGVTRKARESYARWMWKTLGFLGIKRDIKNKYSMQTGMKFATVHGSNDGTTA